MTCYTYSDTICVTIIWFKYMHSLHSAFGGRIITMGLKPPSSPDPTLCDIYLWDIFKDEVYSNNHCTEDDVKEKHSGCGVSFSFTSTTSTCKEQHVCYMWCKSANLRKPFPAASLDMTHENLNSVARHWTKGAWTPIQNKLEWQWSLRRLLSRGTVRVYSDVGCQVTHAPADSSKL